MAGDTVEDLIIKHQGTSATTEIIKLKTNKNVSIPGILEVGNIFSDVYSFRITASNNVRNSHDAEIHFYWQTSGTFVKRKTIKLTAGLGTGTVRCSWDMKATVSGGVCYSKIYKNGVAVGTQKTTTSGSWVNFTDDINSACNPGDTIELWAYQNGGNGDGGDLRNFRLMYDMSLNPTMPSENS